MFSDRRARSEVDRGSANDAVPTSTADAPAIIISTASVPDAIPPTPTIGRSGSAACTSWTVRTATGRIAGPETPPPPAPSTGRRVSGSITIPSRVLIRVTASAPAAAAAPATSTTRSVFADNFAHRGRPHAAVASTTSRGGIGVVGEEVRAAIEVRARQVDLDRHDLGRAPGEGDRSAFVVLDMAAPDAGHHGCAGRDEGRQLVITPCVDPGSLEADAVDHPGGRLADPKGRIAGPRICAERLDHDRPERREIDERRQLGAVSGGARCRHHRRGQRDRADGGGQIDGRPTSNHGRPLIPAADEVAASRRSRGSPEGSAPRRPDSSTPPRRWPPRGQPRRW